MSHTFCNPLDLGYRYSHVRENGPSRGFREAADPTLVRFKDRYYLFASMSAGFWHSADLVSWEFHEAPDLLIYDYAPDVREIDGRLYFCASRRGRACPILVTSDPLNEPFEEVNAPFDFWDPDLFQDDDGRVYLYWGCSNMTPVWGIEMDPATMTPIGEKVALIAGHEGELGYECAGDNGVVDYESSVVYQQLKQMYNPETDRIELPAGAPAVPGYDADALNALWHSIGRPYIEGAFMTKADGRYYLQYACPGTEYNTYSDGVYVGESPLGPFTLQASNPLSSNPGGFITGAGHGSTIADKSGNWWHASTMRISVNYSFERRVGLWPAGFDEDGVMYCSQAFGDYPHRVPEGAFDARGWEPEWMLLSYGEGVRASASSTAEGSDPALAVNEDCRSWWSAGTARPGEWLTVDLGAVEDVRAVQVNLADQDLEVEFPEDAYGDDRHTRHIDLEPSSTNLVIEGSTDGEAWDVLGEVHRQCANPYLELPEGGACLRYVRVTAGELPYGQAFRVSGLRIFGKGSGEKPAPATGVTAERMGDLDATVRWELPEGAQGANVCYGCEPGKLYHSWLTYGANELKLSTLIAGRAYYVRVDTFNKAGVTKGEIVQLA